jgi:2,3-bisphosphoglycerate-dependent phosphoglycerate mutase
MKIFLLRHEDRTMDLSFFSPLTEEGLNNSIKLVDKLEKYKIEKIYSSPFIRTLQTVYPYSIKQNKKINLEYSLVEFQIPDLIAPEGQKVRLPKYLAEKFNYNDKYKSKIFPEDLKYPEELKDVKKRVKDFLIDLFKEYSRLDINILIVSHQIVCNIIANIAIKNNKNKEIKEIKEYPKGLLTKIFDLKTWEYEEL